MSAAARYVVLVAVRGRDPLPALAALLLALLGIFAYRPNELGPTLGLTALAGVPLCAWLTAAVLRAEPPAQADAVTVALGGSAARRRVELGLIAAVAALTSAIFILYPALGGLYDHPPGPGELLAGALAHLTCGALGGSVGVLLSAPRVMRPATQAVATAATVLCLAALPGPLGPLAAATALADDAGVTSALLLACAGTLALAAAARVLARTATAAG